ncbi:MAG: 2-dehydropantoate 2-reductase [Betaproteobacteria bacterium]|nr:2-dehydropantoate 2-reductase [Betaproteobacteria bacterium]
MRILIFGAGAVGGYLGGILTVAGADVTLVARGAQYEALAHKGLVLEGAKSGRPEPIRVRVCRPGEEQPPYDLIFIGLKAQQIAENAAHISRLLARGGMLVFPQNGMPWWYFEKLESPLQGTRLPSLDPDGILAKSFPLDAVIGAVTYKPADLAEPGRIRLADQATDRLVIGELDNTLTPRLQAIKSVIEPAGWPVVITDDIRAFKWRKLLSNAVFNPLGAITQSSALQIVTFPETRRLARAMIEEVLAVAAAVGVVPDMKVDDMIAYTEKRVEIPSSTLQDVRAGRPLELDALDNAIIDIARLTGVATPNLEIVAACANLLNRRIVEDGWAIAPSIVQRTR